MHAFAATLLSLLTAIAAFQDGWLGIYLDPEHDAPRVREFVPGSPAEKAGMKAGDVILAIDETATPDVTALLAALRTTHAGQKVAVRVLRDDKERTLNVTLGAKPEGSGVPAEPAPREPARENGAPPSPAEESQEPSKQASRPRLGCALADQDGRVLVTRVEPASPAARAGIQAGDVLLRVNDVALDSGRRVAELLAQSTDGARLAFVVLRKGEETECVVELAPIVAARPTEPMQSIEPMEPIEPAQPSEPNQPTDSVLRDYDAAIAAAEEAGLQVFVIYGAERDAKTQAQLRAIESPRVQEAAMGYVEVYVDRDQEPELFDAKKFARLPAFEIVRSGQTLWRHDGFLPASAVVAALRTNRNTADDAEAARAPQRREASAPRNRGVAPLQVIPPQGLEELRAEIDALRAEIEALRAEIAAMREERSKAPRARRE